MRSFSSGKRAAPHIGKLQIPRAREAIPLSRMQGGVSYRRIVRRGWSSRRNASRGRRRTAPGQLEVRHRERPSLLQVRRDAWRCSYVFLRFGEFGWDVLRRGGREDVAEGHASAEKARANRVHGQAEQIGDFGIAELLEFTEQQDFAFGTFQFAERFADCEIDVGGIVSGRVLRCVRDTKERAAKDGLAALRAKNLETD